MPGNWGVFVESQRTGLLLTAIGASLTLFAASCFAQEASSAAKGDADQASDEMEEVIVTAQKREERLRDVPLSITAISGDQLAADGISDTRDLSFVTPGLRVDRAAAFTEPAIRGISTQLTPIGNDSNVAMYLDGVYQASQADATFDLPDVQRVEVLKGPQGTLFGRNATGGAIQVFTLDPQQTFNGKLSASYGNFNDTMFSGFVTGPMAPGVSASLSGYFRENDGYDHNILDGKPIGALDSRLVRGKVLIEPTDALSILATAYYSRREDGSAYAGSPLDGNTEASTVPGAVYGLKPFDVALRYPPTFDLTSYGGSVKATLNTAAGTLTSITGYTGDRFYAVLEADYAYTPDVGAVYYTSGKESAFSEEINFASNTFGGFSYIAGLYYNDSYGLYDPNHLTNSYPPGAYNLDVDAKQSARAGAAFGEATYAVTDKFKIVGGLRYSIETRELTGQTVPAGAQANLDSVVGSFNNDKLTPRASLEYALTEDKNLYFTYSKGFKSGAFNTNVTSPPGQRVAPENVTAYEVGVKGKSGPLDFSAAAFYYDYSDIQVSAFGLVNGILISTIQNAAAARIYGSELNAAIHLNRHFSVSTGISLLSAKYTSFPAASVTVPIGGDVGNSTILENMSGKELVKAPEATVSASAAYVTEFAGGNLDLSGTLYYSDRYFFDSGDRISQPSYTTVDARIGWSPNNSPWTFSVYGRNLTNQTIIQSALTTTTADGVSYAPPRVYGGRVDFRF